MYDVPLITTVLLPTFKWIDEWGDLYKTRWGEKNVQKQLGSSINRFNR